jgi:glucose-1-phosphate cytidylyltransferase
MACPFEARPMHVVILCGGMGTRIRDVSEDLPKPLIPIGGRPILWHVMKGYAECGFRRFVLCLGYKGWAFKRFFLDYHLAAADLTVRLGSEPDVHLHGHSELDDWEVTLAETGLETMTGGRVKAVERYVEGDDFLLTYGDGVSDVDVTELLRFHRQHGRIGTVTAIRPPGRFGELQLEGGRVASFSEKPSTAPGYVSGGFFVFKREFFARLSGEASQTLEREPLHELAADGELVAYRHEGFWQCMDNSRDYQFLNQLWAEGRAPWLRPRRSRLAA